MYEHCKSTLRSFSADINVLYYVATCCMYMNEHYRIMNEKFDMKESAKYVTVMSSKIH